jgi:hypothetical protein
MTAIEEVLELDPAIEEALDALDPLDRPIRGAAAIGRVLGFTRPQAYHALESGYVDADKFGGRWVSTARRLRRVAIVAPGWQPRKPSSKEPLDAA